MQLIFRFLIKINWKIIIVQWFLQAEPDWRIGDLFVIEQHQEALAYDHRPRHPITATVNDPTEIQDIFDTITYNKGASVLRMLNHALNDDIFRTSLTLYLNTYK